MKKVFEQPEMMVVNMKRNDIITMSDPHETLGYGEFASGMRGMVDPDDSWANAGY